MNPIGCDQHVATRGHGLLRTVAARERRGHTLCVLRYMMQLMRSMDTVRADACPGRFIERDLQLPTMDRELGVVITRVDPAWFAPDLLAESIGVDQLSRANSDAIERIQETER